MTPSDPIELRLGDGCFQVDLTLSHGRKLPDVNVGYRLTGNVNGPVSLFRAVLAPVDVYVASQGNEAQAVGRLCWTAQSDQYRTVPRIVSRLLGR